jgi:histidinol phosphatase-like enzyme (inositol monophosphatase family)
MSTDSEIRELIAFADELAEAARTAILPHFRTAVATEAKAGGKPGFDPVTIADKAAEQAIRALIEQRYPTHAILGEEFGQSANMTSGAEYCWVIDPIDGTRAFISGLPLWGVLIGLLRNGEPLIGVIDQPYIGERFRGWPGGANFTNAQGTKDLRVAACPVLREAKIATTDTNLFNGGEAGGFEHLRATAKVTRFGCDCYAYAMIAAGMIDLVAESGLAPWDIAALIPVVEGAGGMVTDWRGAKINAARFTDPDARFQVLAAGDARPHREAIVSLRRVAQN